MSGRAAVHLPAGASMTTKGRRHAWISNRAFEKMTGIAKVCMDCGLGLERGERLIASERHCPGRRND